MSKGPIRRGQLIAPFGVGALVVVKDGTSVITAGLDFWFQPEGGALANQELDPEEYRVDEWRLQRLLGVDHFRLPPDFRRRQRGQSVPNTGLTIPFLRFPTWHFCPFCKSLKQLPASARGTEPCHYCQADGKRNYLVQVPFIAICEHGHIQDFPWREWVHRSAAPDCRGRMRLTATGGTSLADQRVSCDCGLKRSLANITSAAPDGSSSFVTDALDGAGIAFRCPGGRPWLGDGAAEQCSQPVRGSLRSASNVYYARVYSAIYLPRASQGAPQELIALLKCPPLSTLIGLLHSVGSKITPDVLRQQHRELLRPFTDSDITKALLVKAGGETDEQEPLVGEFKETPEVAFRRAEFEVLRTPQDQSELVISCEPVSHYSARMAGLLSGVGLVHKLRETRVFSGFSRVFPDDGLSSEYHQNALWRTPPARSDLWLPANVVYGEGVFLQLDEERLREWEVRADVIGLVDRLRARFVRAQQQRRLRNIDIEPRLVLLHTLAHVLMNRLTFECGYGSASLRERLYVSTLTAAPMASVLIYTAAGDSEGTMGGLVRMGRPGYLEPILEKAIRDAEWCSTDPVCMEIGQRQGQGPDGCNGAACHNCSLVPETSCEHFNRFLDRTVLVGSPENHGLGFFSKLLYGE